MKSIYFTPGPAELYPTTIKHFKDGFQKGIASLSHRSTEFRDLFQEITSDLKKFLEIPDNYYIFFTGSGTEAIERTIQNCVEKYSFHFVNGAFSKRFYQTAVELGKKPTSVEVPLGQGFHLLENSERSEDRRIRKSDNRINWSLSIPKQTELLCFTHNESSTGVMTPINEIEMVASAYPDKLVALDIVSSIPYVDINYKLFDVVFFSVQKGFGLPAGMGIMIVSPRAIEKSEKLLQKDISIGSYHGFHTLVASAKKRQTPETPPVLHMYVLGKVIKDMQRVGIKKIRNDTEQKAKLLYEFLDESRLFGAFVKESRFRSQTIIVVDITKAKGDIRKKLTEKGFIVGSGYESQKEEQIRIANFPTHSIRDMKTLIKELKVMSFY